MTGTIHTRGHGFELLNGKTLFKGPLKTLFPIGRRGFWDYPETPAFVADRRLARTDRDFEEYAGFWLISDRMKVVLDRVDPEAFAFLRCKVQLPDGTGGPVRWLCDVVRVLDALDEEKSKIRIEATRDGSKMYSFLGGVNLIFKENALGPHHIFRMKYYDAEVICDEQMRLACKAAELTGLRFIAQHPRFKEKVNAFTFFLDGNAHREAGKYDLAIEAYNDAIRLGYRELHNAFFYRAEAYLQKGDFDHAIADYSEAIRLRQQDAVEHVIAARGFLIPHKPLAVAYHARGDAFRKKGEFERATLDIEIARRLGYDNFKDFQSRAD